MTCKDCIHYDSCSWFGNIFTEEMADECLRFEDKSRYIELPCKVGETLYDISELLMPQCYSPEMYIYDADEICVSEDARGYIFTIDGNDYRYEDFGNTVFFSKKEAFSKLEEAEKALKEQTK